MWNDEADEIIKKLFGSLGSRFQTGIETSMKGSGFIFKYADLLYYKCSKVDMDHVESYISSPHQIKNLKSNNKSYQYTWQ